MATEVIFLRVGPEIKELLTQTVAGMNKSRIPGEPEHTITSVVLGCIGQALAPVAPVKAARKKAARK